MYVGRVLFTTSSRGGPVIWIKSNRYDMRKYPSTTDPPPRRSTKRHNQTVSVLLLPLLYVHYYNIYIYIYCASDDGENGRGTPYYYNARVCDRGAGRRGETVVHCVWFIYVPAASHCPTVSQGVCVCVWVVYGLLARPFTCDMRVCIRRKNFA